MLDTGKTSFYTYIDGVKHYYCQDKKEYLAVPVSSKNIKFFNLKKNNGLIKKNWSASVVDLGDGVVGVELHSVLKEDLNPIDGSIMETFKFARDWTEENNYKGLVLSGDGKRRLKALDKEFWMPILEDYGFNEWVENRYRMGAGSIQTEFSDEDIEQEYEKV